jgi:glycosyltransferase involved in cell wall biosynthesis
MNARSLSSKLAKFIVQHDYFTVIAPTSLGRSLLIKEGISDKNVLVKPHFTKNNKFKIQFSEKKDLLYVGRLSPEKGIEEIIYEFSKLRDLDLNLRLIGDGPIMAKLQKLSEDLGLSSKVKFLGNQPQEVCSKEYRKSKCLIMNSKSYESFGLVVIEAFAAGIPVIAPNFGTMRLIIKDGYNGFLVDPKILDFASKIETIFREHELYRKMCRHALDTYHERYTPEKNIEYLLGCYKYALIKSGKTIPNLLRYYDYSIVN